MARGQIEKRGQRRRKLKARHSDCDGGLANRAKVF